MGRSCQKFHARAPNIHICNAIQQLQAVKEAASSVQILNNAIEWCKLKITTVANQRGEEVRRCGDFSAEYGRESQRSQRYAFCKQVWGWVHNHMADKIQHIGLRAGQEVIEGLRFSCEHFRNEVGAQLNQLKDVQGTIVAE